MPDKDEAREICLDYTLAAARAFTPSDPAAGASGSGKLRFVYLSGAPSERDQSKGFWFMQDYRRIRVNLADLLSKPDKIYMTD